LLNHSGEITSISKPTKLSKLIPENSKFLKRHPLFANPFEKFRKYDPTQKHESDFKKIIDVAKYTPISDWIKRKFKK